MLSSLGDFIKIRNEMLINYTSCMIAMLLKLVSDKMAIFEVNKAYEDMYIHICCINKKLSKISRIML